MMATLAFNDLNKLSDAFYRILISVFILILTAVIMMNALKIN